MLEIGLVLLGVNQKQPVPVRWMRKLGVVFFWRPERIAAAQPGWSLSPVSDIKNLAGKHMGTEERGSSYE